MSIKYFSFVFIAATLLLTSCEWNLDRCIECEKDIFVESSCGESIIDTANVIANACVRLDGNAILLNDNRILFVGGNTQGCVDELFPEIYDINGELIEVLEVPNVSFKEQTATLLADGSVLLMGGFDDTGKKNKIIKFNPTNNTFVDTPDTLKFSRRKHTATLINDNEILVVGDFGTSGDEITKTIELYNITEKTSEVVSSLPYAIGAHTATLLEGGDCVGCVLIAGGRDGLALINSVAINNAFLYQNKEIIDSFTMTTNRIFHSANSLPNGEVLIIGGASTSSLTKVHDNIDIFDPITRSFRTDLDVVMPEGRSNHQTVVNPTGECEVLIFGGRNNSSTDVASSIYAYVPATYQFRGLDNRLNLDRSRHSATLLLEGRIVIAGGNINNYAIEIFTPL